ncbi:MAG TPA: hypothetical protein VK738_01935 [Terriglobales bacterium]|nr:hypothetical protein [Terriglobales bacterium]
MMIKPDRYQPSEVADPPHHWRYKPSSLLTILRFYGDKFVRLVRGIDYIRTLVEYGGGCGEAEDMIPLEAINLVLPSYQEIEQYCDQLGLHDTGEHVRRVMKELRSSHNVRTYSQSIIELQSRLAEELSDHVFLRMERPHYYGKNPRFSPLVAEIYPEIANDIVEAGNCLAVGRGTACVFHLMRIMDFGLQKMGPKLKTQKMQNKNWQQILSQFNGAVSRMPESTSALKKKKEVYTEMVSLLESVKTAWGDAAMTPKQVYTVKEAETLLGAVNEFIVHAAAILNPKSFKTPVSKTRSISITPYLQSLQSLSLKAAAVR